MKINWKEFAMTLGIAVLGIALVFRVLPASVRKFIVGA